MKTFNVSQKICGLILKIPFVKNYNRYRVSQKLYVVLMPIYILFLLWMDGGFYNIGWYLFAVMFTTGYGFYSYSDIPNHKNL